MRQFWRRLIGLITLGLVTWVGFVAYRAHRRGALRVHAAEAAMHLRALADAAISYHASDNCRFDGTTIEPQFPQSSAPASETLCADGVSRAATPADRWDAPTWQALGFRPSGPQRYRYSVTSGGTGDRAWFVARAVGDLDCDGVTSTFERRVEAHSHGETDDNGLLTVRPYE